MKLKIGLVAILSFSFYACQEDEGETKTYKTSTISASSLDTTDCGELLDSIEEMRVITLTASRPPFEMNYEENDLGNTVIAHIGDIGFYRKIAKDTLTVLIFSSNGNRNPKNNSECFLQKRLLDFESKTKDVVYVFYYSEDLTTDDSLLKYKPLKSIKFRMK